MQCKNTKKKKIIKEIESIIKKLDDNNKKIERELKEMDNYSNNYSHKIDLIKKLVQKKILGKKWVKQDLKILKYLKNKYHLK